VYVARAANELSDTMLLARLAADSNGNVREAALNGLRERVAHRADDAFLDALSSADYHVVLAAAEALKGTPHRDERTVGALFTALDRLTKEGRENARDPRSALLDRIEELAAAREASRLRPLVADFDSTIAQRAARILSQWTASTVVAAPVLRAAPDDPVAEMLGGQFELVFHMAPASRGGSFVVRLDTRGAPATAARLVRLARAGYYDGLTFHRVEPGFVIQGGSPQATEYVGDGPFMRDELGLASHRRGTLGISTRGRDTGDAQVFVNLVDNVRLDHDYTVVGEIVRDREIAESVLEAQVIARVEVRRVR
jgi:cyclophilin family peptidyl-prolyl cis-trans isomerase